MQKKDAIRIKIRNFLNSQGISVWGISSAEQGPSVPEQFTPQALLKQAKSVICYGLPIPRGIVFADKNDLDLYWRYCNMSYRSLDLTSNQLCSLLEKKDATAIPIYGCFPWKVFDQKFWGLLPLVYWAEETGLGKLTRCGLLVNPDYGTRILFGGVVTTMDLKPTDKIDKELCPPDCFDCVKACPVHAIEKTGKVNHNLCIRYSTSNPLLAHLVKDRDKKQKVPFEMLLNTVGVDDHGSYLCFKCLKVCPLNNR
jgi:epoxyqueuosine reductase QueG